MAAIRQDRRGVAPGPCPARQRAAEQRRTVIDLDRAAGFRRAGSVSVLSLVMPSPTTPLSVENEVMVGATGAVVSMVTAQRARGHPGIAGGISCRGGQTVAAIGRHRRGVAPGALSARQRAAEQRRTVIDLDRAVGLRRAGQRQRLSLVMPSPTTPLSVENEVIVGMVGAVVSMVTFSALEATPVLPAASVAVAVRLWPPFGRTAVV